MAEPSEAPPPPPLIPAKQVIYCGVCTLPPEYCEFGGTTKKCEEWLKAHDAALYEHLYSEDAAAALTAQLTTLSVAAQERATKDAARKAARATAAEEREASRLASSKVVIRRVERSKRKFVTAVQGLDAFGLDLKKTAKEFGKKFATGSSVTKVPGTAGGEEITVQGDLSCEIEDFIVETFTEVPGENIELVEDKKKKGT